MDKDQERVYVDALLESLQKKKKILQNIISLTKDQQELLAEEETDVEEMERTLDMKGMYIEQLEEIDRGFQAIYDKLVETLKQNRMLYREEIKKMQEVIREVSELGMRIQALEQQNKPHFEKYFAKEKQEIRQFKVSNKTAANYYKNMADQAPYGQSFFLNKKN